MFVFLLGVVYTVCSILSGLIPRIIKALTALVGRLSLSVGWENGPKQGLKTVSFNPLFPVMFVFFLLTHCSRETSKRVIGK